MSSLTLGQGKETFYNQVFSDYGRTKEDIESDVDILLKWCQSQSHFPEVPPINTIRLYLAACKCSVERTKVKLDMYYTIRRLMPEIYSKHPLSPEMLWHSKIMYVLPLPRPTTNQQRLIYVHINPGFDPEEYVFELILVQVVHLVELIFQLDTCYTFNFIVDFQNVKLGHVSRVSLLVVKKGSLCMEKVYANRINNIYLVNVYPFVESFFNAVVKPLLPGKFRDKIKVFENSDILLKTYDTSILPTDIGGEKKSFEEIREMLIEKYEELKPRFDKIQYMTVDETKRLEKLENDDVLGYYGSFKQITVD